LFFRVFVSNFVVLDMLSASSVSVQNLFYTRNTVATCLENLEMSGNLIAVRVVSGNLVKVREMSGKNLVRENIS